MKVESLLRLAGLGLRTAETIVNRMPTKASQPDSRGDRVVARVVPAAERVLGRANPKVVSPPEKPRRRRASALTFATSALLGAVSAGTAAYLVARQKRRVYDRYTLHHAPLAPELLDVLAAPGGGGRLKYAGRQLTDPSSGAGYILVDGIPDFIAPLTPSSGQPMLDGGWFTDLARPIAIRMLGRNTAGDGAVAGAVAVAADTGWALSVPAGRGTFELEMARANPRARILCLSKDWDTLLEIRRRAMEAGLFNVYCARGLVRLLPLQDDSVAGVWSGSGLHRFPRPERELTQMLRVARPGALVAGGSLTLGGGRAYDAMLRLAKSYLPGISAEDALLALLEAAGLKDIRTFRDGAFLRYTAVRV